MLVHVVFPDVDREPVTYDLPVVPRIGETVTIGRGWYLVSRVEWTLAESAVHSSVTLRLRPLSGAE